MPAAALLALALGVFSAGLSVTRQSIPSELREAAAVARLGPIVSWCPGEFRPGRKGFAIAEKTGDAGGGRYAVIESDGTLTILSSFSGGADLSCYSPGEAKKLDVTIAESETVQGQVKPRWSTSVACGFVEDTRAVCWQFSPADKAFVKIGEWLT